MSQPLEVFQVGDRVVYVSFRRRIYGVITEIKTENRRRGNKLISVTLYTIRTDDGGSATKPSHYIERVT